MVGREGLQFPLGVDRSRDLLAGAALGAFFCTVSRRPVAPVAATAQPGAGIARSILVIIVVVAVIVGLIGRTMGFAALIVPQLPVHAIGGE